MAAHAAPGDPEVKTGDPVVGADGAGPACACCQAIPRPASAGVQNVAAIVRDVSARYRRSLSVRASLFRLGRRELRAGIPALRDSSLAYLSAGRYALPEGQLVGAQAWRDVGPVAVHGARRPTFRWDSLDPAGRHCGVGHEPKGCSCGRGLLGRANGRHMKLLEMPRRTWDDTTRLAAGVTCDHRVAHPLDAFPLWGSRYACLSWRPFALGHCSGVLAPKREAPRRKAIPKGS